MIRFCPGCGGDRLRHFSHSMEEGSDVFVCKDCNTMFGFNPDLKYAGIEDGNLMATHTRDVVPQSMGWILENENYSG